MKDDDLLPKLRDWFLNAETANETERSEAARARDYYDGIQYTADERATLTARGQPVITDNRIKPKINYMLGLEKRGRTDPKAWPRTPAEEEGANAATDSIRYVCDAETFEQSASLVFEDMLIEGFGGVDVIAMAVGDQIEIGVEHFPWDRLFYDPHSRRHDFLDAKYVGGVLWMDEDDVLVRWPESEGVISDTFSGESSSRTNDDRPRKNVWADVQRSRLRVVQIHWLEEGRWWMASFTGGGFLDEPMVSPYLDENGAPACSLILQSAFVDRENRRYGIVRDMMDLQDEVNKRRSKALHLLSVRQVIAEQGAVEDVDAARREMAKPDGYVEVAPTMRFEVQQTQDLASGQMMLLADAKASMEAQGPNAFLQGKQTQAASGRAIMASQQGGAIEMDGTASERFRQWKRRVYMAIWCRIKQFWTEERWIRVTDDERNVRFVGLNRTVMNEYGQPVRQNDLARLNVDIVVDEAPDVAVLQVEQFDMLAKLAASTPGLIPPDVLIEASQLRDKDKILDRLKPPAGPDGQPVPPPPPPEVIKAQAMLEIRQQEAAMDAQLAAQKMQQEADLNRQRLMAQIEMDQARQAHDMAMAEQKMQAEIRLARERALLEAELKRDVAAEQADVRRQEMATARVEAVPPPG